jgi:hypothetical protein
LSEKNKTAHRGSRVRLKRLILFVHGSGKWYNLTIDNFYSEVTEMIKDEKIYVVDSPMGSGKTTAMIEYMNSHPEKKYLYIAPLLTEVERIKESCQDLHFFTPEKTTVSKTVDLQWLIERNENIVATHKLFSLINDRTMELLTTGNTDYVLILDETIEVVEPQLISEDDFNMLLTSGNMKITENGVVYWLNNSYSGRFQALKNLAVNQLLVYYQQSILLKLFPIDAVQCFNEIFILTYMFEGSLLKSYFDV